MSKEFTVSELYRSSRYIKDTLAYLSDNDVLDAKEINDTQSALDLSS